MQSPALRQEKPHVFRNRFSPIQQVFQRRLFRTVRMTPLRRSLQLLWVSKQDQFLCRLGHSKHIRQRHLAGFINKERVHAFERSFGRPQPRCPPENIDLVRAQRRKSLLIVFLRHRDSVALLTIFFPMHASHAGCIFSPRGFNHIVEKFPDHLMTQCGRANCFALFYKLANHARARVRFSRTRRALNGKDGVLQGERNSTRRVFRPLRGQGIELLPIQKARRPAEQQIASCTIVSRRINAVLRNPRANSIERAGLGICRQRGIPHVDGRGMGVGGFFRFLDVRDSFHMVDGDDFAELLIAEVHALTNTHVALLWIERIAVRRHLPPRVDSLHKTQLRQT